MVQLVNYYVSEKYTLRYTGGMVPDVNQVNNPEPILNYMCNYWFESIIHENYSKN